MRWTLSSPSQDRARRDKHASVRLLCGLQIKLVPEEQGWKEGGGLGGLWEGKNHIPGKKWRAVLTLKLPASIYVRDTSTRRAPTGTPARRKMTFVFGLLCFLPCHSGLVNSGINSSSVFADGLSIFGPLCSLMSCSWRNPNCSATSTD